MLLIDTRAGSKDLIQERGGGYWLRNTHTPVQPTTLLAADIAFLGNGPDNSYVGVGIEYKKVGDLLQCMCDGRLSGTQLPLLQELYPQQYWLLIEGLWQGNPNTGLLEHYWMNPYSHKYQWITSSVGSRKFTAMEFNGWLTTMAVAGGLRILPTCLDLASTVQMIQAQYHWWTSKQYEDHRSHLAPDNSGTPARLMRKPKTQAERSRLLTENIAARFEGIGWDKATRMANRFKTPRRLMNASADEWMEVDGIGKGITERAFKDMDGGEV